MAAGRDVKDYLQHLKQHSVPQTKAELTEQYPGGLRLVIGNESADLDSIVCAISYAWFLHTTAVQADETAGRLVTVPVIGVPRADWELRPETQYLFDERLGFSAEHVWFSDDLARILPSSDQTSAALQIVLVDHNSMCQEMSALLAPNVTEILDHHVDEGRYSSTVEPDKRRIAIVGSCTTLVTEKIVSSGYKDDLLALPHAAQLRTLLLAPILIDTAFFDPAVQTGTPLDRDMSDLLIEGLFSPDEVTKLFTALREKKANILFLTNQQLLRKDYKQWALAGQLECGISSIGLPLARLSASQRGDFENTLWTFKSDRRLDLLVVLTNFRDDEDNFKRQILVVAEEPLLSQVSDFLSHSTDLNIVPLTLSEIARSPRLLSFDQTNLKASRKQVQPAIVRFANSRASNL